MRTAVEHFAAALDAKLRGRSSRELEALLSPLLASARAAWPDLEVPPQEFARYVALRLPFDGPLDQSLAALHASDLYLACACSRANAKAVEAFERRYQCEIDRAVSRPGQGAARQEDLKQLIREKLFVGASGVPPRIAEYSGRGALRNWVRVVSVRLVLNVLRRGPADIPLQAGVLEALAVDHNTPELAYVKRLYRDEFQHAFADAVSSLGCRDRNLLFYEFAEQLTLEQMAALYGVHRSSVHRWLARARASLLRELRRALMQRLSVSRNECDSILRLVQSQVGISLESHLSPQS